MSHLAAGQILVIAPSADLRNSVRFALEAEGHWVTVRESVTGGLPPRPSYDCVVLDQHAVDTDREAAWQLAVTFRPVVLLANLSSHPLSSLMFRTVLKPTLGAALASAVQDALDARRYPT